MDEFSIQGMRVAVLMGGPGSEREVSLRSGAAVCGALEEAGARVSPLDVQDGNFELPAGTELAFNVIHGTFGEDGVLQEILDARGVPYTGEGAEGSRTAFDKILSKRAFDAAGVPTAKWICMGAGSLPSWEPPYVIKSPCQGSSVGVHIIRSESDVEAALADCYHFGSEVLVEEFVSGRELTVGILGGEALPIVEIVPREGFYDYKNKYTKGASDYHVPASLPESVTLAVQDVALAAHRALGLRVYSRVDVLLAADGHMAVLEANTIPGMTETSLLPKAAAAAGISFPELCTRIAELSMARFPTRRPHGT
ncbi:MAG: D-alanine--D-alanine ligase [Terrimicrobiaceae bacterium]